MTRSSRARVLDRLRGAPARAPRALHRELPRAGDGRRRPQRHAGRARPAVGRHPARQPRGRCADHVDHARRPARPRDDRDRGRHALRRARRQRSQLRPGRPGRCGDHLDDAHAPCHRQHRHQAGALDPVRRTPGRWRALPLRLRLALHDGGALRRGRLRHRRRTGRPGLGAARQPGGRHRPRHRPAPAARAAAGRGGARAPGSNRGSRSPVGPPEHCRWWRPCWGP